MTFLVQEPVNDWAVAVEVIAMFAFLGFMAWMRNRSGDGD